MIAWKSRVPGQAEGDRVGDQVFLDWCQLSLIERGIARQLISRDSRGSPNPGGISMIERNRPADITALSLLFVFGALLCAAYGIALLVPGTRSHPFLGMIPSLVIMGTGALSWLVFVCILCVVAGLGLWRCSNWGFISATVIVVLFLAMFFLRALFTNNWWELLVIVTIGALATWYLRRRAHVFEDPTVGP
jgi:uncharacterized membrane protein (UPF0136 family)